MSLHLVRRGSGDPLLLIHGLGSQWRIWEPVLDLLAAAYDVVAVDLPGFGRSAPLPADVIPTPAALASAVTDHLDALGIKRPHVVGNSLGGWVALEVARAGQARSVTALSPAGLWRNHNPLTSQVTVSVARLSSKLASPLAPVFVRSRLVRTVGMSFTFARPWQVPAQAALDDARAFASAPDFWRVFNQTRGRRFLGGQGIDVPVTIAFGTRDRLLVPSQNAARDQLPEHFREVPLEGLGHAPMWDDPVTVVRVIRETIALARD